MIVLIVVSDGIDNGTETGDSLAMLVLQLERFNGILHPVGSAGFVVSNVDDPALAEMMMNWDMVVDALF